MKRQVRGGGASLGSQNLHPNLGIGPGKKWLEKISGDKLKFPGGNSGGSSGPNFPREIWSRPGKFLARKIFPEKKKTHPLERALYFSLLEIVFNSLKIKFPCLLCFSPRQPFRSAMLANLLLMLCLHHG